MARTTAYPLSRLAFPSQLRREDFLIKQDQVNWAGVSHALRRLACLYVVDLMKKGIPIFIKEATFNGFKIQHNTMMPFTDQETRHLAKHLFNLAQKHKLPCKYKDGWFYFPSLSFFPKGCFQPTHFMPKKYLAFNK